MSSSASGTSTDRRSRGGLQVLELPAPLDRPSGGQLHLAVDGRLRLGDERGQIAPADVRLDVDPTADPVAADLRRPVLDGDGRELRERDLARRSAVRRRRGHPEVADAVEVGADRRAEARLEREALLPLEHGARRLAPHRLHHVQHVARR
jgi:hypothetical protein